MKQLFGESFGLCDLCFLHLLELVLRFGIRVFQPRRDARENDEKACGTWASQRRPKARRSIAVGSSKAGAPSGMLKKQPDDLTDFCGCYQVPVSQILSPGFQAVLAVAALLHLLQAVFDLSDGLCKGTFGTRSGQRLSFPQVVRSSIWRCQYKYAKPTAGCSGSTVPACADDTR